MQAAYSWSSADTASSEAENQKVIEIADQSGSVEGYVGAVEDAEVETCFAGGDGLDVAGTVTNPESVVQDYRLYVSAMADDDTVGPVQVGIEDLAGGETPTCQAGTVPVAQSKSIK